MATEQSMDQPLDRSSLLRSAITILDSYRKRAAESSELSEIESELGKMQVIELDSLLLNQKIKITISAIHEKNPPKAAAEPGVVQSKSITDSAGHTPDLALGSGGICPPAIVLDINRKYRRHPVIGQWLQFGAAQVLAGAPLYFTPTQFGGRFSLVRAFPPRSLHDMLHLRRGVAPCEI